MGYYAVASPIVAGSAPLLEAWIYDYYLDQGNGGEPMLSAVDLDLLGSVELHAWTKTTDGQWTKVYFDDEEAVDFLLMTKSSQIFFRGHASARLPAETFANYTGPVKLRVRYYDGAGHPQWCSDPALETVVQP